MYVELLVPMCDFTNRMYEKPTLGAGCLAQGRTGRWCIVMYVGPEYIKKYDIKPLSHAEATLKCLERGGYTDF